MLRLVATYITQSAIGKSQVHVSDLLNAEFPGAASPPVLFLFDCLITLSQEVDAIWSRKWTATTWLYALTRYGTAMDQILLLTPAWNFVVSRRLH